MVNEAFLCRHTSNYRIATMDNTSLLSNNCTIPTCFCQECRIKRKDHFAEMSLYRMYTCINALSGVREIRSERLFENTLNQIANGKAYHDACLRGQRSKINLKCCQIRCLRGSLPLSTIAEFVTTDGMTLSEIYQIRDFQI